MGTKAKRTIRVGIGGWTYEPWRGSFYPQGLTQKRELEFASRALTSIEINGTYYGSQKPESFAKWHDETPDDFVFALKAPRFATNRKVLAEAGQSIERFLSGGLMALKAKLGPINWQFMATKQFDPDDFEAFLKLLPASHEGRALRHAIEVRHESFRKPEFIDLLRAYGVAPVLSADGAYPQIADLTAPFVYARIMGTTEDEPLGYIDARLDDWVDRVRALADGRVPSGLQCVQSAPPDTPRPDTPRDVYLYVISGYKAHNPPAAMALIDKLR
ncbi:DUF72 domain-containing protein [Novosphingobium lentum]|uniref:DUF72 domain-containing protein n=1 Tax=Novosphingobium lentum TaxID=145287 RepID=UPI000830291D|nr:DUF72 domain-containing protein [Novosphingobium lentum]